MTLRSTTIADAHLLPADPRKQTHVDITMLGHVAGEDGTDWMKGETHQASVEFAHYLARLGKAVRHSLPAPSDAVRDLVVNGNLNRAAQIYCQETFAGPAEGPHVVLMLAAALREPPAPAR